MMPNINCDVFRIIGIMVKPRNIKNPFLVLLQDDPTLAWTIGISTQNVINREMKCNEVSSAQIKYILAQFLQIESCTNCNSIFPIYVLVLEFSPKKGVFFFKSNFFWTNVNHIFFWNWYFKCSNLAKTEFLPIKIVANPLFQSWDTLKCAIFK